MRGVILAFSALFVAISSAIGCADDPGPGPIPLDELRDELSTALCNQYARCGQMPDQATCDAVQGDTRLTLQLLTDAVLGRVTYDEAGARTCVEAIRNRVCDNAQATQKALNAQRCMRQDVCRNGTRGRSMFVRYRMQQRSHLQHDHVHGQWRLLPRGL